MGTVKAMLASVAALGLTFANPALASIRSGDSLPSSTAVAEFTRAAAPMTDASEANPQRSRLLLLFLLIGAVGLLIAASSGGGKDSPG